MDHLSAPVLLDQKALVAWGRAHSGEFAAASPFPHVVAGDLLDHDLLRAVAAEVPDAAARYQRYDAPRERKLAMADETQLGPLTRRLLHELNGQAGVAMLEALTGIEALLPDPMLFGGGVHRIEPGGLLKVHADFDLHPRLGVHRRLNLLVYLNEGWQESWGGQLELWDRAMTRCERKVTPVLGRCVVFATSDEANHGHPEPLTCPPDRARCSLALYYYTAAAPPGSGADPHTTIFRARPGEAFSKATLKQRLRPWLPPAAVEATEALLARRKQRRGR